MFYRWRNKAQSAWISRLPTQKNFVFLLTYVSWWAECLLEHFQLGQFLEKCQDAREQGRAGIHHREWALTAFVWSSRAHLSGDNMRGGSLQVYAEREKMSEAWSW